MRDQQYYTTQLQELIIQLRDGVDSKTVDEIIDTASEFKKFLDEKKQQKQLIDEWYTKAESVSNINEFKNFAEWIFSQNVDYETAVHAVTAIAIAATWLGESNYGLTGFQGSFVGLQYLMRWTYGSNCVGLSVTNYTDMLYPQNQHSFEKTIPSAIFSELQKKASECLKKGVGTTTIKKHWQSIVDGEVPFGYKIED